MAKKGGDVVFRLLGDDSQLGKKLLLVKSKVANVGRSIGSAFSFSPIQKIAAGIITSATINRWIQLGDSIQEASQRTGISVDKMSRLKYAADLSGTSMEAIEKASRNLAKSLYGANSQTALFGRNLNILRMMNPEQQFMSMLAYISRIKNPTIQAAVAMKIFGETGTAILPLLANGMAGLNEQMDRAKEVGAVFTDEQAEKAARYADAISDVQTRWTGLAGSVLSSPVGDMMLDIMSNVEGLFDNFFGTLKGLKDMALEDLEMIDYAFQKVTGLRNAKEDYSDQYTVADAKARNEAAREGIPPPTKRTKKLAQQAAWYYRKPEPEEPMLDASDPGNKQTPWTMRPVTRRETSWMKALSGVKPTYGFGGDDRNFARLENGGIASVKAPPKAQIVNPVTNITISHANFVSGEDMVSAYNRKQSMLPGMAQ